MKKSAIAAALSLAAFSYAVPAGAQERLVRFDGGIGVITVTGNTQATIRPNVVRGVNPGGQPWVIESLRADVRDDGMIRVDGRGLLLAGGDNIGTNGNQSVHARLFCGTVPHNSGTVPLEDDGDFRIDGQLSPVPPAECVSPVLLIVSGEAPGGNWFAAGIPKR